MGSHCCSIMAEKVDHKCSQHPDPFACPDHLVHYSDKFDEYGLIVHDGGRATIMIFYCPWCGDRLPASKREQWFAELYKRGIHDPWNQDIPKEFRTGAWRRNL